MNTQLIKDFMDNNGMTNADMCRLCGIGHGTLNRILDGKFRRGIDTLIRVSRVMNCTIDELLGVTPSA